MMSCACLSPWCGGVGAPKFAVPPVFQRCVRTIEPVHSEPRRPAGRPGSIAAPVTTDLSVIPPFVRTVARRSTDRRPLAERFLETGEAQVYGRGFGKRRVQRRGDDLAPEMACDRV